MLVGRQHAYHGVNFGGLSVQGLPLNQEGWGPLLGPTAQIDHDDLSSAERLFDERGDEIAAVIAEPVIGAGGVYPATVEYLRGLRKLCDEAGALLIFDEVITGFGRLGVVVRLAVLRRDPGPHHLRQGRDLGLPPAGRGDRRAARSARRSRPTPTSCCATATPTAGTRPAARPALANISILRDEHLLDRVPHIGERLGGGLAALVDEGLVAEVRGEGAIWALAMHPSVSALDVRAGLLERGVIARPIGTAALAFCPPFVIDDDDIDLCVSATGRVAPGRRSRVTHRGRPSRRCGTRRRRRSGSTSPVGPRPGPPWPSRPPPTS